MKSIRVGLFSILVLLLSQANAQDVSVDWARSNGGSFNDIGNSITSDNDGNVFITGVFSDTVDFDPGNGVSNLISKGLSDVFIQKLDADGNFIWAVSLGGVGVDNGASIVCDDTGNLYITGMFSDTVDFDPGALNFDLIATDTDAFVLKLDSNGDFVWAKSIGGSYTDLGKSIALKDSTLVLIGSYEGSVDFDPGPNTNLLSSSGAGSLFILKMDFDGNFVWVKSIGEGTTVLPESVAIGAAGNIFLCGQFVLTIDFNPGAGVNELISNGGRDFFVLKLDSNGEFIWAKGIGGLNNDSANGVSVDAYGNVFITGDFRDSVNFDAGQSDFSLYAQGYCNAYILKLDHNGNYIWAKAITGVECVTGNDISVTPSGDAFIIGKFNYSADFNPGIGNEYLSTNYAIDVFILSLNYNGEFVWAGNMGGDGNDEGNSIWASTTGVYATGYFEGTVDFDPSPSPAWVIGNEFNEIFSMKLSHLAGLSPLGETDAFNIYPNPVSDLLNIESKDCDITEFEIFNIEGKRILTGDLKECLNRIDVNCLRPGFYNVIVNSKGLRLTKKIIKL